MAHYQDEKRRARFEIQVSGDAKTWEAVFGGYSSGDTTSLQLHATGRRVVRYVRIVGHGNEHSDWNSITEVQFVNGE